MLNGWYGPIELRLASALGSQEIEMPLQRYRNRLEVCPRTALRFLYDHFPNETGIVELWIRAQSGKQSRDYPAMAMDCAFKSTQAPSQLSLEGQGLVVVDALHFLFHGCHEPTFREKAHEPSRAVHVFGGYAPAAIFLLSWSRGGRLRRR